MIVRILMLMFCCVLLVGSVREYLPAACPTGQTEHLLLLLLLLLLLYNLSLLECLAFISVLSASSDTSSVSVRSSTTSKVGGTGKYADIGRCRYRSSDKLASPIQ